MSVKKRLFWSNTLMFALPLLVYLLFSLLADRMSWLYLLQQRPLALPLLLEGTLLFAECMDFLVKLRKFCGVRFLSSGICCRFLLAADGLALDFKLTQTA